MHLIIFLLFFTGTVSSTNPSTDVEVATPEGTIVCKRTTWNGSPLYEFLGIPFAQPPTGDLRFRKTQPLTVRPATLFAQSMPPACPQYVQYNYTFYDAEPQSEDCLYLNVWVPGFATHEKKAVMFWILGGAFIYGSNSLDIYNGSILAAENDVIVVSPSFRLGVLGFLSSDSELAPGNMALYDILEALKWVKNNIEYFGGNSKKVTFFGDSSGAITAGIFCISPLARGLFQRAILQSRSPVDHSYDHNEANMALGQRLAEAVGCANNKTTLRKDAELVVDCLKRIDAERLVRALNSLNPAQIRTFNVIFGDELLPLNPKQALQRGYVNDVSVFLGFDQDEGTFDLIFYDTYYFGGFGEKNPYFNKTVGSHIIQDVLKKLVGVGDVVQYYLGHVAEYDYEQVRQQTYHALGDGTKVCPTIYFGDSLVRAGKDVYFYYFNHRPTVSQFEYWMGVYHFSDVAFIFGQPLIDEKGYTEEEKELSRYMMALWTNFAKCGKPATYIEKSTPRRHNYIYIRTNEWKSSYLKNHVENCQFYKTYFDQQK